MSTFGYAYKKSKGRLIFGALLANNIKALSIRTRNAMNFNLLWDNRNK